MRSNLQRPAVETDRRSQPRFVDPSAAFETIQTITGRKWHLRIVYHLLDEPKGFSDLKSALDGVSGKMLSESLSTLDREGLVNRTVVSDQPVRVEYALTERGAALEPALDDLIDWTETYGPREDA
ncbi:winged helix-turn-helix transcriptional regulator [Halococcoides cellulosivorans]|uniref:Transcriptional regulator n=1 Tax=Halococcoides cellulosivorans TaxID=1679096 RepID=A0A2R4X1I9_9EURY|nr:helix-turn-helix domain-containing protein [Halococcoides cellulosivorans]AWB27658.1 transcriptional regulator [Halococcoides cellulosivorans]